MPFCSRLSNPIANKSTFLLLPAINNLTERLDPFVSVAAPLRSAVCLFPKWQKELRALSVVLNLDNPDLRDYKRVAHRPRRIASQISLAKNPTPMSLRRVYEPRATVSEATAPGESNGSHRLTGWAVSKRFVRSPRHSDWHHAFTVPLQLGHCWDGFPDNLRVQLRRPKQPLLHCAAGRVESPDCRL